MAFVDELLVTASAGRGGDGAVYFRRERGREFGGPSGGNGGRGGDVYVVGSRDLMLLGKYRHNPQFFTEEGGRGGQNSRHGKDGKDLYIELPVGSVVTNTRTGKRVELLHQGQTIRLLRAGGGGLGNEHFKSSKNIRPRESTAGKPGEHSTFLIELELVVDAGFIGFPNAGKSSLLNALTNAQARVGAYPFTTLDPNLGDLDGFIIADIPGLIEKAAEGKGLGHKFLRHIKRTRLLVHLVSLEHSDAVGAYETVRHELDKFGNGLSAKPQLVVLTKADLVDRKTIARAKQAFGKVGIRAIHAVSIVDKKSIVSFAHELVSFLRPS